MSFRSSLENRGAKQSGVIDGCCIMQMHCVNVVILIVCACRMGCRCFWDPKTDDYAQQVFSNVRLPRTSILHRLSRCLFPSLPSSLLDNHLLALQETLFCVASAYGVYLY